MDESKNKYLTGYILKKNAMPIYAKSYWRKKDRFPMKAGQFSSSKVLRRCPPMPLSAWVKGESLPGKLHQSLCPPG